MSETRKRIPKDRNITLTQIVHNRGYYDIDNNWNSILYFQQYPGMLFRGRVEVFIFDKYHNVYMMVSKRGYRIPGGSWERNRSHKFQVEQEAKEEARILLGKINYTNYSYFKFFKNRYTSLPMHWDGTYNEVYVAEFKDWYCGPIRKDVRDISMSKYGKFVPFDYAINIINKDHQRALNLVPRQ